MEIVHSNEGWRTKRAIKADMVEQGNKIMNMTISWRRQRERKKQWNKQTKKKQNKKKKQTKKQRSKHNWEEIKSLGIKKEKLRERIHIKKGRMERNSRRRRRGGRRGYARK